MVAVCVYGNLPINDGPLKGKRYAGGHQEFLFVCKKSRCLYVYRAYSPPWKRLRMRSAYYVSHSYGPLSKSEVRRCEELGHIYREPCILVEAK